MEIVYDGYALPDLAKHKHIVQFWNDGGRQGYGLLLFLPSETKLAVKWLLLRNHPTVYVWDVKNGTLNSAINITNNIEMLEKPEFNNLWK